MNQITRTTTTTPLERATRDALASVLALKRLATEANHRALVISVEAIEGDVVDIMFDFSEKILA